MFNKILYLLVGSLLFFPEYSIDTSLAMTSNSYYSIYFTDIIFLSIADLIIVLLTLIVVNNSIFTNGRIQLGILAPIFYVYMIYYLIGIYYNIYVAFEPKALLYDLKAGLYLFIPFMIFKQYKLVVSKNLIFIFFGIYALGSLYDSLYVLLFSGSEYPTKLGFLAIQDILPIPLLTGLVFFIAVKKYKILFPVLLFFEISSSINKVTLSGVYSALISLFWVVIVKIKFSYQMMRANLIIFYYFLVAFLSTFSILVLATFIPAKQGGFSIRKLELINFVENSMINIPIIIGKGLGSTWKEIVPIEGSSVYSTGINFLESTNNFIWHNSIGGVFYKFGLIGSLVLLLIGSSIAAKTIYFSKANNDGLGMFAGYTIFAFVMSNIIGIGILKWAVLSSFCLYLCDFVIEKYNSSNSD